MINVQKLTTAKEIKKFSYLLMFTYMISYITRVNYGAIVSEMENATSFSKSMLSMAITGSFITYGIGQIVSGILGDKFSPKKLVSLGFIITIAMNLLIPVCNSHYLMVVVWCINGFAQAFMWPPIVKLMTFYLSSEDYVKASVVVSWGSSLGTIVIYLLSPLLILLLSWKFVFVFSAICGAGMLILWNRFSNDIPVEPKVPAEKRARGNIKILFTPHMLCIMLAIVMQGMLRDGVTTWMPSYISETYNMNNLVSILTGVILPVFGLVCFKVAAKLYQNKFENPLSCAGVIFAVGMLSAILLVVVSGKIAIVSVLCSALLTGCMHGVNLMLVCILPSFFQKHGNVSTVSGVLNSCTYIGSSISAYGIASITQNYNWGVTIFLWAVVAFAGTIICFGASRKAL